MRPFARDPLEGTLVETSAFGPRVPPYPGASDHHGGVDLRAPMGTPVLAADDGVVSRAFWDSGGGGNVLEVKRADGSRFLMMHLTRWIANVGDTVRAGDTIAVSGATGTRDPHLHFEARPYPTGAVKVDPWPLFPGTGVLNASTAGPLLVLAIALAVGVS